MKHLKSLPVFVFFSFCISCFDGSEQITCVQLDPLEKVFKEQMYFIENNDTAAVAKGETVSFQFVIRGVYPIKKLKIEVGDLKKESHRIPVNLKAFVGYIRAGRNTLVPSRDRLIPVSDLFPDQLIDEDYIDVPSLSNQPVWINFKIPRNAKAGIYEAKVIISGEVNGKRFKIEKPISTRVYDVELPEQSLWVTNWFYLNDNNLRYLNNNSPVEPFSDLYWDLVKILANKMRDYGQNVYRISPLTLCKYTLDGDDYTFDFSNFDKMVELFIQEGNLKRIEGSHIAYRLSNSQYAGMDDQFGVSVPENDTTFLTKPFNNDTTQNFISQFIPSLYKHLKNKGWDEMYCQHIGDEPSEGNVESYILIAKAVKEMMPDIKIIDAIHTRDVDDLIDIWVPLLNNFHSDFDFFQNKQEDGDELWYYTCLSPKGNYANRFMEQPLIQTRILHWINYKYNATGYLHWGLNWWEHYKSGEAAGIIENGGNIMPAGDSWIIYPGYRKVYGSIRFEAMRDGIADYELLKLLEKKYPQEAEKLAGTVVYRFDYYDNSIASFREKRIKLLELLSK